MAIETTALFMMDLDLFLDTRLVTLGIINPSIPLSVLEDDECLAAYSSRPNDQFLNFGLKKGEFDFAYARRNVDTLKLSKLTRFCFEVNTIAREVISLQVANPNINGGIEFQINMHPYTDLDNEVRDAIIDAISCRLPATIKVTHCCYAPEELTSRFLASNNYMGLYLYNFTEWLEANYHEGIPEEEVVLNPSLTVAAPLRFENLEKLQELAEFENPQGEKCDPIQGISTLLAGHFGLHAMDTMLVSIITPKELAELELKAYAASEQSPEHNRP